MNETMENPFEEVAKDPALAMQLLTMQHNRLEELNREVAKIKAERHRTVWALVAAAGGKVRIPDPHRTGLGIEDMDLREAIFDEDMTRCWIAK